jgi:glycosyltransferase involved in cell wall biosynthesis
VVSILADHHHGDLWESPELLFTDRFGWDLYRLRGMEWWDEGYWQYERGMPHGEDVAKQYLQPWGDDRDCGTHWERDDPTHPGRVMKMLTLEQAQDQKPDIILATLTENEPGLEKFARSIGAKYGIQVGNQGTDNHYDLLDFAMFSTTRPWYPDKPHVTYHQEFSLADYRYQWPPTERDKCSTWVQCLQSSSWFYSRFVALAELTPELRWRFHGHCNQDDPRWESNVLTSAEVAAQMRAAGIGIHFKQWSDGYGHVIHSLFAVGKPVIATAAYYDGRSDGQVKLAAPLFVDGVTSFDVQSRTDEEVVQIIRRLATDDDFHRQVSEAAYARFKEVVDFDADAEAVRAMFEQVL